MPDGSINNNDCKKASQASPEVGVVLSGETAKKRLLETKECVGCDLTGAYLWKAELQRRNLSKVNLSGAYLRNASLAGADLSNADLTGADLYGADLRMANLRRSDLTGANLSFAKGANLNEAQLCNTTMPDGVINNRDC